MSQPNIDIVIIGLNAAQTLSECIQSMLDSNYDQEKLHFYYVDCGSHDQSVAIANTFDRITVIETAPQFPTAAKARNTGWKASQSPFVQFIDSDTTFHPDWLPNAITAFESDVGAVQGELREKRPNATLYNWIADQEWNVPPGESEAFGGNVLIRREALEKTGGYLDELAVGEDPELSTRVRESGWRILQLPVFMGHHDIGMTKWQQFVRRSYRCGYSYAARQDHLDAGIHRHFAGPMARIWIRGWLAPALILLSALLAPFYPIALCLIPPGGVLLFYPRIFSTKKVARQLKITLDQAKTYTWMSSLVTLPQSFGAVRYLLGKLVDHPLRNKRKSIQTRSSSAT